MVMHCLGCRLLNAPPNRGQNVSSELSGIWWKRIRCSLGELLQRLTYFTLSVLSFKFSDQSLLYAVIYLHLLVFILPR